MKKLSFIFALTVLLAAQLSCEPTTPTPIPSIGSVQKLQGTVQAGPESALENVDPDRKINNEDAIQVHDDGKAKLDFGYGLVFTLYNNTQLDGTSVDQSGTSLQVRTKLSQGGLKGYNPTGSRTEVLLPNGGKIIILGTNYFVTYDAEEEIVSAYNMDGTVQYSFDGNDPTTLPTSGLLEYSSSSGINIRTDLKLSGAAFDEYATKYKSPTQGLDELINDQEARTRKTPTPTPAATDIYKKYISLGGEGGVLGAVAGPETKTPDGRGLYQEYEGGSIYWLKKTGAFEVHGAIREKWLSMGGVTGALGFPLTDETTTPDGIGRYNHFEKGSIYWSPKTGAHEIHGAILVEWASIGWEQSVLGYPLTDETITPDGIGRYNQFQNGVIYWSPNTGAHEVHGYILKLWTGMDAERGRLGYPTSDELIYTDGTTRYNTFQYGCIYWVPGTDQAYPECPGIIY
ncbi:MAG: hypothetical protein HZB50_08535 [Chloroflexi bacterium]|nr:hypothetical protein [Chloroflexota bacterium]